MPTDFTCAEAAAELARKLLESSSKSEGKLASDVCAWLLSNGFSLLAGALPDGGGFAASARGGQQEKSGDEAPFDLLFAVSNAGGAGKNPEEIEETAAFAALAAAAAASGKKTAFVYAREDFSGAAASMKSILEASPQLKKARVIFVPSPVRSFEWENVVVMPVAAAFKGRASFKLQSKPASPGIPGSLTRLDAVGHLTRGLQRIANQGLSGKITPEANRMFYGLRRAGAPALSLITAGISPSAAGFVLENSLAASPLAPFVKGAVFNDAVVASLNASCHAPDGIPKEAHALLNVSYVPGVEARDVMFQLRNILDDAALSLVSLSEIAPVSSPTDCPLFGALMKAAASQGFSVRPVPWLSAAVPDALLLGASGSSVYGLPFWGSVSGDELSQTAWKKSVRALAVGIGIAEDGAAEMLKSESK